MQSKESSASFLIFLAYSQQVLWLKLILFSSNPSMMRWPLNSIPFNFQHTAMNYIIWGKMSCTLWLKISPTIKFQIRFISIVLQKGFLIGLKILSVNSVTALYQNSIEFSKYVRDTVIFDCIICEGYSYL